MMKRLLYFLALIVALSACKDSVKEDPTPAPVQTPEPKPTIQLTLESISVILDKSVVVSGKISNAEEGVKEYGFVYSKTADFNLNTGTKSSFGSEPQSGFTTQIQGLETKTNYTGKLYLIKENNEVIYSSAKQFSTAPSNTWQMLASPPVSAYDCSGFVIGDTVYYVPGIVLGEKGGRNLYAYDLVKNKWVSKGALPFSPRVLSTSFSLNGKGYIMLGRLGSSSNDENTDEVWEYDAATNTWAQKASCPSKMHSAAGFLLNDKLYVTMGKLSASNGYGLVGAMYEYDPLTNIWTTKATSHPFPNFEAYGFGNSYVHNGRGYIYAGAYKYFPFSEYNPEADTWATFGSTVPGSVKPTGTYAVMNPKSIVIKDRLFTSLGDNRNGEDMYQYDIVEKNWLKIGTYPVHPFRYFITNFKDKIFLVNEFNTFIFLPESD